MFSWGARGAFLGAMLTGYLVDLACRWGMVVMRSKFVEKNYRPVVEYWLGPVGGGDWQ